jgi:hypothetical protein
MQTMTSVNRFVATVLCGAMALSMPAPLQAQSPAECEAAINKLQAGTEKLGKDLDADVKDFIKSEYADGVLTEIRAHYKSKPSVQKAFELKDKYDKFSSWVEETQRARVTMEDLGKCIQSNISGGGCSLIEFAKRQNEVIAKWIKSLGDEGLTAAAERVNKQANIIRTFTTGLLSTATNGTLDTLKKCETQVQQQSTTNEEQPRTNPATTTPPSTTPPPPVSGGGSNAGKALALVGAAIGGGLVLGTVLKQQEEDLGGGSGGGGSNNGGGGGSNGGGGSYTAAVSQRSCTGPGTIEPCNNSVETTGTCNALSFTVSVSSSGQVTSCRSWLTGSVSNGSFTGNYQGSCGSTIGPRVSGAIPGTISGTSVCLGNTYTISMTVR